MRAAVGKSTEESNMDAAANDSISAAISGNEVDQDESNHQVLSNRWLIDIKTAKRGSTTGSLYKIFCILRREALAICICLFCIPNWTTRGGQTANAAIRILRYKG